MALLAETIVEEWLNRQGFFTIRGAKLGVHEMDILALRWVDGQPHCRHIEVQASMRPVSYISRVPRAGQKNGRAKNSAKRSDEELTEGVAEWVKTKFRRDDKHDLMQLLCKSEWSSELVVNVVKSDKELDLIEAAGVRIHRLSEVVRALSEKGKVVQSASGADMADLISMGIRQAHNSIEGSQA